MGSMWLLKRPRARAEPSWRLLPLRDHFPGRGYARPADLDWFLAGASVIVDVGPDSRAGDRRGSQRSDVAYGRAEAAPIGRSEDHAVADGADVRVAAQHL